MITTSRFQAFIRRETTGGLVLMIATILALILANSKFSDFYQSLIQMPFGIQLGSWAIKSTLQDCINSGLMSFFFLIVGLELKREMLVGDLSDPRAAALPLIGAFGGMLMPAFIYVYFNINTPGISGWGIPMATDIAFAVGLLALLGNRIPNALIVFLVALAIADDLGSVLVIALFYTEKLHLVSLVGSGVLILGLLSLNLLGIRRSLPYFIIGVLLWAALLKSGIHATLAGIFTAAFIPAYSQYDPLDYSHFLKRRINDFSVSYQSENNIIKNNELRSIARLIEDHTKSVQTPLQRLEHRFHLPVTLIIVPLFALFNAGVALPLHSWNEFSHFLKHPITLGVGLGLLLGKLTGITGFCWLATRLGLAKLPQEANYLQLAGIAMIAGVGFTMSLFISDLAFAHDLVSLNLAKIGILLGSLISGTAGIFWLLSITSKNRRYIFEKL